MTKQNKPNNTVNQILQLRSSMLKAVRKSEDGYDQCRLFLGLWRVILEYLDDRGIELTKNDIKELLQQWPEYSQLQSKDEQNLNRLQDLISRQIDGDILN